MEALLFILDAVVLVVVMYWGLMDERRAGTAAAASPFRFADNAAEAAAARKNERLSRNAPARRPQPGQERPPLKPSAAAKRHADAVRRREI